MEIYTSLLLKITTGEVIAKESFEYDGPLALLGGSGGGSSTTNTVDYNYNARMAALSEEQQEWAREYFSVWQNYQKKYEIEQANANLEMLPIETRLYKNQINTANDLIGAEARYILGQFDKANQTQPLELQLYKKRLEAAEELLPLEVRHEQAKLVQAERLLPAQADTLQNHINVANNLLPLREQLAAANLHNSLNVNQREADLYSQGLETAKDLLASQAQTGQEFLALARAGVDVNERMALAAADSAKEFESSQAEAERTLLRMGVNPNSGRFAGSLASLETLKAAQVASAKTQARVGAEAEEYQRLQAASAYNGMGVVVTGSQAVRPDASYTTGQTLQAGAMARPDGVASGISGQILAGSESVKIGGQVSANQILQGITYLKG